MTEDILLSSAEIREVEGDAISSGLVTGLELMERAGLGAADAIEAEWPELVGRGSATVLCGPGNNGGDGFVVARILAGRGWRVQVALFGRAEGLPPDARAAHDRWRRAGGPADPHEVFDLMDGGARGALSASDVVVDAVFGTGLSRPVSGELATALAEFDGGSCRKVALDVPSGLCADSGRVLGAPPLHPEDPPCTPIRADLTVTFHAAKTGHHLEAGPLNCGRLRIVPIGLPCRQGSTTFARPMTAFFGKSEAAHPGGHKFSYGHVLVLAGGRGRGGAARLAARAALRAGAGLVTVGCQPDALTENAARLDSIMLRPVAGPAELSDLLSDTRITSVCLGPGYGLGGDIREAVEIVLAAHRRTVLDGDALTAFADDPHALFSQVHEKTVLTPHAGEFARLFPDIAERLGGAAEKGPAYSKVDAAREAARRAGCIVVYKGPDTVIADAGAGVRLNSAHYGQAVPWLATAGAGDVLAGLIAGLNGDPDSAVWLHAEAARAFGPGLIAEDLPEMLPQVFRKLGL